MERCGEIAGHGIEAELETGGNLEGGLLAEAGQVWWIGLKKIC